MNWFVSVTIAALDELWEVLEEQYYHSRILALDGVQQRRVRAALDYPAATEVLQNLLREPQGPIARVARQPVEYLRLQHSVRTSRDGS